MNSSSSTLTRVVDYRRERRFVHMAGNGNPSLGRRLARCFNLDAVDGLDQRLPIPDSRSAHLMMTDEFCALGIGWSLIII